MATFWDEYSKFQKAFDLIKSYILIDLFRKNKIIYKPENKLQII